MKTVVKWIVKDKTGQKQIFESYVEAYNTYQILKEAGDENVTVEKQEKFLLTE